MKTAKIPYGFRLLSRALAWMAVLGALGATQYLCNAKAAEFTDEIERGPFFIRSREELQITNNRGSVTIQGWSLDKIRVKARRKVIAENAEEAKKLFSAVDIRFRATGEGSVELSAEYGRKLEIEQRLKERENPKTSMEIQVFAPANLKTRVWALEGKVFIRNRSAPVEIRTSSGPIEIDGVKGESVSVLCPNCPIVVKRVQGSVRCMGGTGDVELTDVKGGSVYVETSSGAIHLDRIQGDQLYVSKSGTIAAKGIRGQIQFHTQQAGVEIADASGFLTGKTETGNISAKIRSWRFVDKAFIESVKGNIALTLPAAFSGDLDIRSASGHASVAFPLQQPPDRVLMGPDPANQITGRVGEGGELLKVFSEAGDVQILRGD